MTNSIYSPASHSNPTPDTPWVPMGAALLGGTLVAWLISPGAASPTKLLHEAAYRALATIVLIAAASTLSARWAIVLVSGLRGVDATRAMLDIAAPAVWLGLLTLPTHRSPLDFPLAAAILLGMGVARALRRNTFQRIAEESLRPEDTRCPLFHRLPATNASSPPAFIAFTAILTLELSVLSSTDGQVLAGVSLAAFLFSYRYTTTPAVPAPNRLKSVSLTFLGNLVWAVLLGTAAGWWLGDTSRTAADHGYSQGGFSSKDLLSGVVLLAEIPKRLTFLPPPTKTPARSTWNRSKRQRYAIAFSGEYWIYPIAIPRPPKSSLRERGSPINMDFLAEDHTPLMMKAWQRLGAPIDRSCCSSIEVKIRNRDPHPKTIEVELTLLRSGGPRKQRETLGVKTLPPGEVSTLPFAMPKSSLLTDFNELEIGFNLSSPRMHRSANVAIEEFELVP